MWKNTRPQHVCSCQSHKTKEDVESINGHLAQDALSDANPTTLPSAVSIENRFTNITDGADHTNAAAQKTASTHDGQVKFESNNGSSSIQSVSDEAVSDAAASTIGGEAKTNMGNGIAPLNAVLKKTGFTHHEEAKADTRSDTVVQSQEEAIVTLSSPVVETDSIAVTQVNETVRDTPEEDSERKSSFDVDAAD